MAIEDWIDDWFIDDEGPYEVTCNRCGAEHLEWGSSRGKWVLLEPDGELHKCDRMAQARAAFGSAPGKFCPHCGKPIDL